jgi:hypothetical protein
VAANNHVLVGNAPVIKGALRATFDRWRVHALVLPNPLRMAEREFCSLAGILAGSLALSKSL